MIVVRLTGGIGNQLFQFALGHGLAERSGQKLILDKTQFQPDVIRRRGYPPHHQDYLKDLDFSYTSCTGIISFFEEYFSQLLRGGAKLKWKIARPPISPKVLLELAQKGNLFLTGYWQSLEYVSTYAENLRALLLARMRISDDYIGYRQFIDKNDVVSVHLRFGDYVHVASNAAKYNNIGKEQLANAIQNLRQRQGALSLLVFSDELDQARTYFDAEDDIQFVEAREPDPISELALMSSCRHHIISNSTFSWWAAYLGAQEHGLVYCPGQWRKDMEFQLCLSGWQRY